MSSAFGDAQIDFGGTAVKSSKRHSCWLFEWEVFLIFNHAINFLYCSGISPVLRIGYNNIFYLIFRNKLERISKASFQGLFKLEKLKLSDNRIQVLEEGSLGHLLSLSKLDIADNSLVCNCSLAWFSKVSSIGQVPIAPFPFQPHTWA